MRIDRKILTVLFCLLATFCFSQNKTVTFQTKASSNQQVDGQSFDQYQRSLQSYSDYISISKDRVKIDLVDFKFTAKQLESMMGNIRVAGFSSGEYNKELSQLSFNLNGNADKFTLKDIAHSILWESGLR